MLDGYCLNILLFWRRSTAALVFRVGACLEVSLFCPPFPTQGQTGLAERTGQEKELNYSHKDRLFQLEVNDAKSFTHIKTD